MGSGSTPTSTGGRGSRPTQRLIGGLIAMALSDWEAAATLRVFNLYLRQAFDGDRFVVKARPDRRRHRFHDLALRRGLSERRLRRPAVAEPEPRRAGLPAGGPWRVHVRPSARLAHRLASAHTPATLATTLRATTGSDGSVGSNAGYTFFSELAASAPDAESPGDVHARRHLRHRRLGPVRDRRATHGSLRALPDRRPGADRERSRRSGGRRLRAHQRQPAGCAQRRRHVRRRGNRAVRTAAVAPEGRARPRRLGAALHRTTSRPHENAARTPVGSGETVLELTYQIALAPWLVVQPDAQFFFDPAFSRRDAQAIGAQVVAIF